MSERPDPSTSIQSVPPSCPAEGLANCVFEARLRNEIDRRMAATPAMLHSIDEAGFLVSVSDAWLAKLGYSRDEVLGRRSSDFLTPESRERADSGGHARILSNRPLRKRQLPDGEEVRRRHRRADFGGACRRSFPATAASRWRW